MEKLKKTMFVIKPIKNKSIDEITAERNKCAEISVADYKNQYDLDVEIEAIEGMEVINSILENAPSNATPRWYVEKVIELIKEASLTYITDDWKEDFM